MTLRSAAPWLAAAALATAACGAETAIFIATIANSWAAAGDGCVAPARSFSFVSDAGPAASGAFTGTEAVTTDDQGTACGLNPVTVTAGLEGQWSSRDVTFVVHRTGGDVTFKGQFLDDWAIRVQSQVPTGQQPERYLLYRNPDQ